MLQTMRPVIATCHHAASSNAAALALAREIEGPVGVEITARPLELERAVRNGAAIRHESGGRTDVRYHFPLGTHEITDVDPVAANEALSTMRRLVALIAQAGSDSLTVHAPLPTDAAGTPLLRETAGRLRELVVFGREHGVSVCLENLRWGLTSRPAGFVDLVERTGASVTFDVGHGICSSSAAGGFSAERFILELGARVESAHIYGRENERHHPPASIDDIAAPLEALLEAGCGWWTVELTDHEEIRITRSMLTEWLDARCPLGLASQ